MTFRVARYLDKNDQLYCHFTITTELYEILGKPPTVSVGFTGTNIFIRPTPHGKVQMHQASDRSQVLFSYKGPLFPGTKVFGVEALECAVIDGVLVSDPPRMLNPIKVVKRGSTKSKKTGLGGEDTGKLVMALNAQRRSDKRLSFRIDEEGYIRATKEFDT